MYSVIIPISKQLSSDIYDDELICRFLYRKVKILSEIACVDEIIVISDIYDIVQKKLTGFNKLKNINRDTFKYQDYHSEIFEFSSISKNDSIIYSYITTPLIKMSTYIDIINKFEKMDSIYDSLVTVNSFRRYLFNKGGPINFSRINYKPTSQLEPIDMVVNGAFIANKNNILKWGYPWGMIPYMYNLSDIESVEIRTQEDLYFFDILDKVLELNI